VDNKYVKATFAQLRRPVAVAVYKPTGNDLLYKNPSAPVPDRRQHLLLPLLQVWGGIMPTSTSPSTQVLESALAYTETDTPDAGHQPVDNRQHQRDELELRYGPTGLTLTVTYTIHKSSPAWTCRCTSTTQRRRGELRVLDV